jgi:hypothetical protein
MKTNGFEAKDHNLTQFCKVEKIGNYDVVFIWSQILRNGSCSISFGFTFGGILFTIGVGFYPSNL